MHIRCSIHMSIYLYLYITYITNPFVSAGTVRDPIALEEDFIRRASNAANIRPRGVGTEPFTYLETIGVTMS